MDKQITGHVMRHLLETQFENKSDMARQLGIPVRTIQRVFENLDNAKVGTIALDKAICYCALHHISLDSILDRFDREGKSVISNEEKQQAYKHLVIQQPENLTAVGIEMYESMLRFLQTASAHVCPNCKKWCNPWSGERFAEEKNCYIGHMAREIRRDLSEIYGGNGEIK